jgi:hypothetical protein
MNFLNQSIKTVKFALLFAILCMLPRQLNANPTSKNPQRGLAAHGTIPEAKALCESMYQTFNKGEAELISMFGRRDNPASFSNSAISRIAGEVFVMNRNAELLRLMGEPASTDLASRTQRLNLEINQLAMLYSRTAQGAKHRAKVLKQLNKERPNVSRFLDKVQQQIQRGQLEGAEKQLEAKGRELAGQIVWFSSTTTRNKYIGRLITMLSGCTSTLNNKRRTDFQRQAQTAIAKQLARVRSFGTNAASVVAKIGVAPANPTPPAALTTATAPESSDTDSKDATASVGDDENAVTEPTPEVAVAEAPADGGEKPLSASEAFSEIARLWGSASASLIRANAIELAFINREKSQVKPSSAQLMEQASAALVAVVEAAAKTTPPEKAAGVYSELLIQISIVNRRQRGNVISKACEGAMAKLAARKPGLEELIVAYKQIIAEPLRWRKRFASQQADAYRKDITTISALMGRKSIPKQHIRPNYTLFQPRESVVAPLRFSGYTNWMVYEAGARLIQRQVIEKGTIRISPTSRTAVVPFYSNHYCNLPVSLPNEKQLLDLRSALMVDDTNGPLSIEAADAISSAQLHDYKAVVGKIEVVHLESPITRFIALPDLAYVLAPLGRLPISAGESQGFRNQTCWRFDIRPQWAQHEYFNLKLPEE